MKKICLTCKHVKYHDSVLMLCIEDIEFSTPIAVEHNFNCKNYNKLSNKGIIKRLAEIHGIESHKYNEYDDYICDSCESKIHEQLINELTKDNK